MVVAAGRVSAASYIARVDEEESCRSLRHFIGVPRLRGKQIMRIRYVTKKYAGTEGSEILAGT